MDPLKHGNLFADLPVSAREEVVTILAQSKSVRVERIVSTGQSSPAGFWYDQSEEEWVVVLAGEAELRFEHQQETLQLRAGDHLLIPAGQRHRIEWTSPHEPTVWLAIFFHK